MISPFVATRVDSRAAIRRQLPLGCVPKAWLRARWQRSWHIGRVPEAWQSGRLHWSWKLTFRRHTSKQKR